MENVTDIDISKAPLAKPARRESDTNEDVYLIHQSHTTTEIRVPADTPVRMQDSRWYNRSSSDPRSTLPNMEIKEESILIPFCDIVEMIVARAEPVELAKALWENEDVRREFVECLTARYSQSHIVDRDRRVLVAGVNEEIHSKALDLLVDRVSNLEGTARDRWLQGHRDFNYNTHYQAVLDCVEHICGSDAKTALQKRFGERFRPYVEDEKDFDTVGKHWRECREYWRAKTLELFPGPEIPDGDSDRVIADPPAMQPPSLLPAITELNPTATDAADGSDIPF